MIIGLDACSIINLVNGGALDAVLSLPHDFMIGPEVVEECEPFDPALQAAVDTARIQRVDPAMVNVNDLVRVATHGLGDGETETIALGLTHGWTVCSDDRRARDVTEAELGPGRVIGSIGLLNQCVIASHLTAAQAYVAYEAMVAAGGFLPNLAPNYFEAADPTAAGAPAITRVVVPIDKADDDGDV